MSSSEQQPTNIHTPLLELRIQDLEQMSDEEFWRYAHQRAQVVPGPPLYAEYVECKLSNQNYLLALSDLVEVLSPPQRLARLPGMPLWMVGLMAWRGETIAIVDLDRFLFPSHLALPGEGTLLVTGSASHTLGLLVPSLGLTTTIEPEQIVPCTDTPDVLRVANATVVEGMYTGVPLLNISALLAILVQQIGTVAVYG